MSEKTYYAIDGLRETHRQSYEISLALNDILEQIKLGKKIVSTHIKRIPWSQIERKITCLPGVKYIIWNQGTLTIELADTPPTPTE